MLIDGYGWSPTPMFCRSSSWLNRSAKILWVCSIDAENGNSFEFLFVDLPVYVEVAIMVLPPKGRIV